MRGRKRRSKRNVVTRRNGRPVRGDRRDRGNYRPKRRSYMRRDAARRPNRRGRVGLRIPLLPPTRDGVALFVRVTICGRDGDPVKATALIDTGSSAVCISPRLAKRCKATIVPGRKLKLLFIHRVMRTQLAGVWLAVHPRAVATSAVLIVQPWTGDTGEFERKHDVILGARWLRDHRARLDFGRRTLTIQTPTSKKGR